MHDDQDSADFLKQIFLIKYPRSNYWEYYSNTSAIAQCVLTQVPLLSISRSMLTIFRRLWHWGQNLHYLYKDLNNKICFRRSSSVILEFSIFKSCSKTKTSMLLQTYQNKQNANWNIIWFHFSVLYSGNKKTM